MLVISKLTSPGAAARSLFAFGKSNQKDYIKHHGYYKNDILTKSALIFPNIEDAPLLRELTVDSLFQVTTDNKQEKKYYYAESLSEADQKLNNKLTDEPDQLAKATNSFLNHGKLKFDGPNSPEVVIVTGIDFETNELSHLVNIVQNRVNYAEAQKYGIYVRWVQEFLPILQPGEKNDYKSVARLSILRNAMYAFPKAKYFWYLHDNSMIMKYDVDLLKYLLNEDVLSPILMRDQPLIPPKGIIHTFKNQLASEVEFLITQMDQDLNADSFIFKNSFFAKALLEFWSDSLFRKYHGFVNKIEDSLLHLLQWHPVFLGRTGIVPARTIASLYSVVESSGGDSLHYAEGDFVVNLRDCEVRGTCDKEVDQHYVARARAS